MLEISRLGVVLLAGLTLSCVRTPREDPHDPLVYGRYSRGFSPTEFKVGGPALDRPATPADVAAGRAIFSLQGLGDVRIWQLPEHPVHATWPTAPAPPSRYPGGCDSGQVYQAEELRVDGRWKRYLGFVGPCGAAVVCADQVNLWLDTASDGPVGMWHSLPGGLEWGVASPGWELRDGKRRTATLTVGSPLPVTVHLRNRRGAPQELPVEFYRDAGAGGPALRDGVTLRLERAPFDARTADPNYPRNEHFKTLTPKRHRTFAGAISKRRLETGQSVRAFDLDLRDWFVIDQPGYYQFHFEYDRRVLGLPNEPQEGASQCTYSFTVGSPPPKLTYAQLNESIPPLGGNDAEARLRALILKNLPPATQPATRPANEPQWSKPVGGITARIEYLGYGHYAGLAVLLRLKNLSDAPLSIPAANPVDSNAARIYELHLQRDQEPWRQVAWLPMEAPASEERGGRFFGAEMTGNQVKREPILLQSGQSAVVYLCGDAEDEIKLATNLKVVLRQPAAGGVRWHGALETPPQPARRTRELGATRPRALAFPDHFPEFSRVRFMGGNMSGMEAAVTCLGISNRELEGALEGYESEGMRRELERRLAAEMDEAMRLYLAALAIPHGSRIAAMTLLEAMKSTDYKSVTNVHAALRMAIYSYESNPPDWLVQLAIAALADQRYVTGLEMTNWSKDTFFTVSYLADEHGNLTSAMGHLKCAQAIPVLTEMVRRDQARGAIMALGEIGGGRDAVLAVLQDQGKNLKIWSGCLAPEVFSRAAWAAAQMKMREAVPILLRHLCHNDIVEALEEMGDPAAIPALEKLVADGKPMQIEGSSPEDDLNSVWAARVALATLKEGDPLPRYWQLLADRSLGEFRRADVAARLATRPDPRSVPHLVAAIKTDPAGGVTLRAIWALSTIKDASSVEGLIECFNAEFKKDGIWKRQTTPETYREEIAKSLCAITGQTFGPDKSKWAKWWRDQGGKLPGAR